MHTPSDPTPATGLPSAGAASAAAAPAEVPGAGTSSAGAGPAEVPPTAVPVDEVPVDEVPAVAVAPGGAAAGAGPAARAARRRWSIVVVVLAALMLPAAALVVINPGWAHRQAAGAGPGAVPDGLRVRLADAAVPVLETAPEIEHLGHDHDTVGPRRVMCTVDPFGVDPPGAGSVAEVRWVYALHLCVIGEAGLPWDYATKSAGPVAVGLGSPATVRLPQPRIDYRTQVQQMIPARYQPQAFGSFAHPELIAQLRQRYNAEVASAPAAAPTASS